MIRANPVMGESLRGLASVGQAQIAYLNCLLLQGAVLLFWWPKRTLSAALLDENPPDSLLAMVIIIGITTAYYALRSGGEEVLMKDQQPLRAWVVATTLSLPRILIGFVCGRLLQSAQALFLSSPLLLAAYSVGGGTAPAVAWCVATVLMQALFYQLLGATLYALVGHYSHTMLWSLRVALVVIYSATLALLPSASHVVVSYELLSGEPWLNSGSPPAHLAFLMLYAGVCLILAGLLLAKLAHFRRRFEQSAKVDNRG